MKHDTIKANIATREQVGSLGKSAMNPHGRYKYVSIDTYYEKVSTTAAKNGLSWIASEVGFEVMPEVGKTGVIKATYEVALMHRSGDYIPKFSTLTIIHPIQGAQTVGSAMSYLDKVFMRQLFSVATGEKDSDADETNPADIIGIGADAPKKEVRAADHEKIKQIEAIFTNGAAMAETEDDLKDFWASHGDSRNILKEHNPEALKRVTAAFTKRKVELTSKENEGGN
jgi:hypothetical protein